MQPHIRPKPFRRRYPLPQGGNATGQPPAWLSNFSRFRVLFDLLLVLLEADGSLVTKEWLLSRVWPGVVVSEENLKFQVHALRKALGADRDLILTEFGRGYRFTGVLRTNIVLEPCRPVRSKWRSGRRFLLQSCRHSLQCSVIRSRALTGEDFAVSTQ
jgi:Transcriptional regulatory protein, C terminal